MGGVDLPVIRSKTDLVVGRRPTNGESHGLEPIQQVVYQRGPHRGQASWMLVGCSLDTSTGSGFKARPQIELAPFTSTESKVKVLGSAGSSKAGLH